MKDKRHSGQINPRRLAEEADSQFVELAGLLMRFVSWDRPIRRASRPEADEPRPSWKPFAFDKGVLASIAEKLSGLTKRGDRARNSDCGEQRVEEENPIADTTREEKLKKLFHQDAWHRLAAVRWLRQHRCFEAISALEGALSIEESDEVRGEIERAIHVLTSCRPNNKGESRCSRSSEVSF